MKEYCIRVWIWKKKMYNFFCSVVFCLFVFYYYYYYLCKHI